MLATRDRSDGRGCERLGQERVVLTELKDWETCVPSDVTAAAQTAMIRDSITPYSTAVGPSSLTRKRFMLETNAFM
jgi:hypothetical protein